MSQWDQDHGLVFKKRILITWAGLPRINKSIRTVGQSCLTLSGIWQKGATKYLVGRGSLYCTAIKVSKAKVFDSMPRASGKELRRFEVKASTVKAGSSLWISSSKRFLGVPHHA